MYVCVCVCVCVYIYIYIHAYTYTHYKENTSLRRVLYIDDECLYISYRFMPKRIVQTYKFTSHKARNLTSLILSKRIYNAPN
jgi:hypothetical protein